MSDTSIEPSAFQPRHFFAVVTMLAATVAVLVAPETSLPSLILISLAVMSAGLVAMAAFRTIAPLTATDEPERAAQLGGRAHQALEREKALVLRSIKELEFDRAMGKIAEPDFAEMSSRLRARAIGLMKQLDRDEPDWDAVIAREVARRRGMATTAPGRVDSTPSASAAAACAACGTSNDADARFCKACGARLAPLEAPSPS
ncbi:MAG: zinc-ribbon domain-containing protein [Vicinamibacterales bacterium]